MTSIKTTQTLVLDRYSRILVPLPPVQSIKNEVKKLVEDTFKTTPEYVETDWCEGYAISWRSWYGFENLRHPFMRSFFPLKLERILDDWLGDEEAPVIEWVDENNWEWMDIVKDADEIFRTNYWKNNSSVINVYSDYLSFSGVIMPKIAKVVSIHNLPELMKPEYSYFYPILKVLARRGYWNIELDYNKIRNKFYERIGFEFERPFQI